FSNKLLFIKSVTALINVWNVLLPLEKQKANSAQYARHLLYEDPLNRFEVLALVWKDGQSTPLHDHDGTWGVEGVFTGKI
ncbi:cysteine dioxygenase, partial [Bacillus sp. D-CC]